ncbi:MAG: hypothetical protein HGB00_08190 [Chlorobiaceae bacterium]|nr:hypothetical protein [Chlorobiaceae bacterium]
MHVESLKFQRGAIGAGDYYYGIGVNVDDPAQTQATREQLRLIDDIGHRCFIQNGRSSFFEEKDVTFLTANFEYDSFLVPIRFDPADAPEMDSLDGIESIELECGLCTDDALAMDKLLWWMSAKGEGSWSAFRDAVSLLWMGRPEGQTNSWPKMRKFLLLGDVEMEADGRWGCTPTTIVQTESAGAYLAGKSTPVVLRGFNSYEKNQNNGGPTRIGLDHCSVPVDIPVIHNPALAISSILPAWSEWMGFLQGKPDIAPHRYTLRLYDGHGFNVYEEGNVRPGFYEVEKIEGSHSVKQALYDGQRWLGGAFYDLRWLAKKIGGADLEVRISREGSLLIPEAERWPLLYERPLVLSSGRLPALQEVGEHRILAYTAVGGEVAGILAGKLGIKLKET